MKIRLILVGTVLMLSLGWLIYEEAVIQDEQFFEKAEALTVEVTKEVKGEISHLEVSETNIGIDIRLENYEKNELQGTSYKDEFEYVGELVGIPDLVGDIETLMKTDLSHIDEYHVVQQKIYLEQNVELYCVTYQQKGNAFNYDVTVSLPEATINDGFYDQMNTKVKGGGYYLQAIYKEGDNHLVMYHDMSALHADKRYIDDAEVTSAVLDVAIGIQDEVVSNVTFQLSDRLERNEEVSLLPYQEAMIQRTLALVGVSESEQQNIINVLTTSEQGTVRLETISGDSYTGQHSSFQEQEEESVVHYSRVDVQGVE